MTELVIVSWNLQGRNAEHVDIAAAMAGWNADVALLQEADARSLDAELSGAFRHRRSWPDAGTPPGIMIVSRLRITEVGVIEPVDPPWDRPRVCWGRLETPAGPLTVASVHLLAPLAPGARRRRDAQRKVVATWARARSADGAGLVVGGDFNTREPRLDGMTDATVRHGPTWRPLGVGWMPPVLRIDALFASAAISVLSGHVDRRYDRSDHLPLVVRIGLSG